jgi:hypothetical protein
MFGDGRNGVNDNWLLPICLDKLKLFVRQKKEAHANIRKLEKFMSRGSGDIANAFEQWKTATLKTHAMLMGKTQQELFDRSNINQKQLDVHGDEMEYNQD